MFERDQGPSSRTAVAEPARPAADARSGAARSGAAMNHPAQNDGSQRDRSQHDSSRNEKGRDRAPRVMFVPTYYYTHYDFMVQLGQSLREAGAETFWLHIEKSTSLPESDIYTPHRIRRDGFQYRQIPFRNLIDLPLLPEGWMGGLLKLYERLLRRRDEPSSAPRPRAPSRWKEFFTRPIVLDWLYPWRLARLLPGRAAQAARRGVGTVRRAARGAARRAVAAVIPRKARRAARRALLKVRGGFRMLAAASLLVLFHVMAFLWPRLRRAMPRSMWHWCMRVERRMETLAATIPTLRPALPTTRGRHRLRVTLGATRALMRLVLVAPARAAIRAIVVRPLRWATGVVRALARGVIHAAAAAAKTVARGWNRLVAWVQWPFDRGQRIARSRLLWLIEQLSSHVRLVVVDREARVRLEEVLRAQRIDCVVIGSHLGGRAVLVLQDACRFVGVPVVSVWKSYDTLRPHEVARPTRLQRRLCRWNNTRALFLPAHFHPEIMRQHMFVGVDDLIGEHLRGLGIPAEKIVTAPPSLRPGAVRCGRVTREELEARRGGPIVFVTETLQELRGDEYLALIIADLKAAVAQLDEDVLIEIRFHPREPEEVKRAYREAFRAPRFRYPSLPLEEQVQRAGCLIASFSSVANEALLAGCPVFLTQYREESNVLLEKFPVLTAFRCAGPGDLGRRLADFREGRELEPLVDALRQFQHMHFGPETLLQSPDAFAAALLESVLRPPAAKGAT